MFIYLLKIRYCYFIGVFSFWETLYFCSTIFQGELWLFAPLSIQIWHENRLFSKCLLLSDISHFREFSDTEENIVLEVIGKQEISSNEMKTHPLLWRQMVLMVKNWDHSSRWVFLPLILLNSVHFTANTSTEITFPCSGVLLHYNIVTFA